MLPAAVVALSGLALSAGQAALEHGAQNRAARANRQAAEANFGATMRDLRARRLEERRATGTQIDRANQQVSGTRGSAQAAAAASGIGGVSIRLLLGDIESQGAAFRVSAQDNLAATESQLSRFEDQAAVQRDNQILGIQSANPLLTGLKIGAAGLDALTTYRGMK